MAASRLLLAVAFFAVLAAASALLSDDPVPLVPYVPQRVYLAAQQNGDRIGAYFSVNTTVPGSPSSFVFLVARDTTRAPVICYWSTVKTHPSWIGNDPSFVFSQESNAHRFTASNSPTRTQQPLFFANPPPLWKMPCRGFGRGITHVFSVFMAVLSYISLLTASVSLISLRIVLGTYYIGCYIRPMGQGFQTVSAQFESTVVFYNGTQHTPPSTGTITMSSNLLQSNSTAVIPAINATFSTISVFTDYAFYLEPRGCGYSVLVNEMRYVMANLTRFRNVSFPVDDVPPEAIVTLTDFDPTVSVFCLNLVAFNKEGQAEAVWLAQTLYYPHVRDGIQPEKVNPRKWRANIYVPLICTCLLFVGAPVGIIIHRIWLARRRAQKRAASGPLMADHDHQVGTNNRIN